MKTVFLCDSICLHKDQIQGKQFSKKCIEEKMLSFP